MGTSPLSGILSPQQIAVLQQARAMMARAQPLQAQSGGSAPSGATSAEMPPPASRGRGQIVNIVV